ncbi:MAG TPA: hypothetical protein VJQ51_11385 [Burkholderiales bacterium]|nr:hypothetical protein [Burkholderiales bacterium]
MAVKRAAGVPVLAFILGLSAAAALCSSADVASGGGTVRSADPQLT